MLRRGAESLPYIDQYNVKEIGIDPMRPATWPDETVREYMDKWGEFIPEEKRLSDEPMYFYNTINVNEQGQVFTGGVSDTPYEVILDPETGIPLFTGKTIESPQTPQKQDERTRTKNDLKSGQGSQKNPQTKGEAVQIKSQKEVNLLKIPKVHAAQPKLPGDDEMMTKFNAAYPRGYSQYSKVIRDGKELGFFKVWEPVIGAKVVSGSGTTFTDDQGRTWDIGRGRGVIGPPRQVKDDIM